MKFPVTMGYDSREVVGWLVVDELPNEALVQCAIIPAVVVGDTTATIADFAIVPRTTVDTRPRPELGEEPRQENKVAVDIPSLCAAKQKLRQLTRQIEDGDRSTDDVVHPAYKVGEFLDSALGRVWRDL